MQVLIVGAGLACRPDRRSSGEAAPASYERVVVLGIGVSEFRNTRMNLDTPADTVTRLGEVFRTRYGYEVAPPLLNEAATKAGIEDYIEKYGQGLTARDAVILIVATHGASVRDQENRLAGYLVPHDALLDVDQTHNFNEWDNQAVGMRWLGETVRGMNARQVLVLVEACCSGYMGLMGHAAPISRSAELLAKSPSRIAITAGGANQPAVDGVFGSALLGVLTKQTSALTARELHILVRDRVMYETGDRMTPQVRELAPEQAGTGIVPGEFVFIPRDVPAERVAAQIEQSRTTVLRFMGSQVSHDELIAAFEELDPRYTIDSDSRMRLWLERVDRYKKHAGAGDTLAMTMLSYCYGKGLGVDRDGDQALRWAQEAYDSGLPIGKLALAYCYDSGTGVPQNLPLAQRMALDLVDTVPIAKVVLAMRLAAKAGAIGQDLPEPDRGNLDRWSSDAISICPSGMCLRGLVLLGGIGGVPKDMPAGVELLREAADAASPAAMYFLGTMHSNRAPGVVEQDFEKAAEYFRKAAEKGHADSQAALGNMLFSTKVPGPKDPIDAMMWTRLAVAQGSLQGLLNLSYMVTKSNPMQGRAYLEQAVEAGYRPAMVVQGVLYAVGHLYPQDERMAVRLFLDAAGMASAEDAYALALELETPEAVALAGLTGSDSPSVLQPHVLYWLVRAAAGGKAEARTRLRDFFTDIRSKRPGPTPEAFIIEEMDRLYPGSREKLTRITH